VERSQIDIDVSLALENIDRQLLHRSTKNAKDCDSIVLSVREYTLIRDFILKENVVIRGRG